MGNPHIPSGFHGANGGAKEKMPERMSLSPGSLTTM